MKLLRILCSLADAPVRCKWALFHDNRESIAGEGALTDLPRHVAKVQLIIPATQVLLTCAHVPMAARRHAGSVLAFAVEEKTVSAPDANSVSWLGTVRNSDALAVVDKPGLKRWCDALDAIGIRDYEIHCETLLLPWAADAWSLVWNGHEGIVRTGEFEGAVTDCGDRETPPLSLRLMLEDAKVHGARPDSIALYTTVPDVQPDIDAWARQLDIAVRFAGIRDWRTAPPVAGVSLAKERQRWRIFTGVTARLRPAAWMLGTALAIHAAALITDWTLLANEQRALRQQMESQFRAAFPNAVAVADPVLQMRRKLAEARHGAGLSDHGDFLPIIGLVTAAAKGLPAGSVRVVSYEAGRMTLELAIIEEAALQRTVSRLLQAGLHVDMAAALPRTARPGTVLIVRAS